MKIENIVVKKSFKKTNGEEKTYWNQVGILKTTDDGKRYIELHMFPNTAFYVFEPKEKETGGDIDI